ncbi:MAG TPA: hypothetical protein VEU47_19630 [Candidatus Cybelea sp.]|nr:hypothetical protein [Candidatus Cybelea sp.]
MLFRGPGSPVQWAVKDVRGGATDDVRFSAMRKIVDEHQPDVLVLEDCTSTDARRGKRMWLAQQKVETYAISQTIEVCCYSRKRIRECFKPHRAMTRYEIAKVIATQIHALSHRLPPVRKLWMDEDSRMGLFDAASLVLTHYWDGSQPPSERRASHGT